MATIDPAASLVALGEATSRLRAASSADDVLDVLVADARSLVGVADAWAARVEGLTISSVRSASGDHASEEKVSSSAPPFSRLLSTLTPARPITRADGFVVVSLAGSTGAAEGLLAYARPASAGADNDGHDLVLAPLAAAAGLALEASRLRARIDLVTRAREVLLASVSHDLRNPLNTFAMSAGLLRDDLERNDVDSTRGISLVSRMERATSRMQGLIEDLVEASRIDARKIDFAIREERASQLLADACAAATSATSEKGAAVVCDTPDEEVRVMADRARTLQLIAKVIAFEAKCTGDGGTLRLAVARHGEAALFTARALGPGGTPVPAPEEGRGGLALLIARGLVEAQRGTFRVEAGDGLVVAFTLPAAKG